MKQFKCNKCNGCDVFLEVKGSQKGLYCSDCGSWLKWIGKDEFKLVERYIKEKEINKNKAVSDVLVLGFDKADNGDHPVLSISRLTLDKQNVLKTFKGDAAVNLYKLLTVTELTEKT